MHELELRLSSALDIALLVLVRAIISLLLLPPCVQSVQNNERIGSGQLRPEEQSHQDHGLAWPMFVRSKLALHHRSRV